MFPGSRISDVSAAAFYIGVLHHYRNILKTGFLCWKLGESSQLMSVQYEAVAWSWITLLTLDITSKYNCNKRPLYLSWVQSEQKLETTVWIVQLENHYSLISMWKAARHTHLQWWCSVWSNPDLQNCWALQQPSGLRQRGRADLWLRSHWLVMTAGKIILALEMERDIFDHGRGPVMFVKHRNLQLCSLLLW